MVTGGLIVGAGLDPVPLFLVRVVRLDHRLVLEMPPFPALRGAERLGPLSAGRADAGEGVPAGNEHLLGLAGVEVGSAELHGADAAAVLDGELAHDVAGQRHGHALGACAALRHSLSLSPGSVVRQVTR